MIDINIQMPLSHFNTAVYGESVIPPKPSVEHKLIEKKLLTSLEKIGIYFIIKI